MVTPSQAQSQFQQLLPDIQKEVADQDLFSGPYRKIPPQPYMNEVYWPRSSAETPAFFRDSLVQFVARTYDLTRGNLDGSKSQAWAGGGWLAFRSGLIGDVFGVQVATYTSQPIFAPLIRAARCCWPRRKIRSACLGRSTAVCNSGTRNFAAGVNWWTRLLSMHKTTEWCQTRLKQPRIVSLPDNERKYDYAVGYLWNVKQRDSERLHSYVRGIGR